MAQRNQQNNNSRVNIVRADASSVFDKKDLLLASGYFNRTRWERSTKIDVLPTNDSYLDLMLHDKDYCESVRGRSRFGHTIEATIYTEPVSNKLLFATVASRKEADPNASLNQAQIDASSQNENFMFASVFPNTQTSTETGQGNTQVTTLESVQLFRYDPVGQGLHPNRQEIYDLYKTDEGENVANYYRAYFEANVGFPHFHFSSRTMAETYGKTAEADAISLDSLIDYVEDLMFTNGKNHVLNNYDFGMPYLRIKNNPNCYKTAIDVKKLQEALMGNSVNIQLGNIFKQTQKLQPDVNILTGLEAVYSDLVLLRILRGGGGPSPRYINQPTPNIGGPQDPSGGGFDGGTSGGHGRSNFITVRNQGNDRNFEVRNRENVEQPQYEVSLAELQLSCKIASAGNMKMKNSKGRDKMHFEEANAYIDRYSERMLANVLELCLNQRYKGEDNGPTL